MGKFFLLILKSNLKFSDLKITNDELAQSNMNYSIHNIKILIVYSLAKIMEKVHQRVKKIKLIDVIKKRNFKSSKKSKNANSDNNIKINTDNANNKIKCKKK